MKQKTLLLAALLVFTFTTAFAQPVVNDMRITQIINRNIVFSVSTFDESIQDLDGGELSSIYILELPDANAGNLELSDTILTAPMDIGKNDISNLKFVPANDFIGSTTILYKIGNNVEYSNEATITIEYTDMPENTAPESKDITLYVLKNTPLEITLDSSDVDMDNLLYAITQEPEHGMLDKTNINSALVTYTPDADYLGADTFQYVANDGKVDSNTATVTLTVVEEIPNVAPVAMDMTVTTDENTQKEIQLLATDADGNVLTYTITSEPSKGTLDKAGIATGLVIYTPNEGYTGTDSFKFQVNDGKLDSNVATVTVTVEEQIVMPTFVYEDLKPHGVETQGHWVNFSASSLADRGAVTGEKVGTRYFFYPEYKITRWEFLNYIIGCLDLEVAEPDMELVDQYEDAQYLSEYLKRIASVATQAGILNGVDNDGKLYIKPFNYLTRAEAITMINNFVAKDVTSDDKLDFFDKAEIPDWAMQAIVNMKNYKIIQGYEDNTIKPNNTLTKAQTIEMLFQTVKYIDKNSEVFRMIKNKIS